jgi:hypothetical protein
MSKVANVAPALVCIKRKHLFLAHMYECITTMPTHVLTLHIIHAHVLETKSVNFWNLLLTTNVSLSTLRVSILKE